MQDSVSPDIDQWISSNIYVLCLLERFNHDYSGEFEKGKDSFASLLSAITNAPNLQFLGRYHALRFWNEILLENERNDVLIHLLDSNVVMQRKGIAELCALYKRYIPIVDPPLPYAVPVWKLFVEWPDEQWQDMVEERNDDSLNDTFPGLSGKIRIPANLVDHDWEFISTACSHSEGQDVSLDVANNVCRQLRSIKDDFWLPRIFKSDPATSLRSFFSSPVFGDVEGAWYYVDDNCICPVFVYFYAVKHANARLRQILILLDWYVADTSYFPVIIANTVHNPKKYGEYQVCYQAIGLLYIARTAIAEIASPMAPQRVSVMAFHISHSGVKRYIFSFCGSQPEKIQYWYKYFDFEKLEDLGRLWLELWNSRKIFPQQFHGFPLINWVRTLESKHRFLSSYPDLTPLPSTVIFSRSRSRSQCVDPLDQEQRKNRVAWLNSSLREYKYRVDKFIHANVVRIVHWSTLEATRYAKFLSADSYELFIHNYLLSFRNHPHNRTVPILYSEKDPEGHIVIFTPNVGDRLSRPSTVKKLLDIALQVCQAVNFMHQNAVAHLDLKFENILLSPDGCITIIDFSCAFQVPPPPGLIDESVGTPGYMAPEVEEGNPYNPILADIYSLGWVLRGLCCPAFVSFYDMAESMTVEDPCSRPPLSEIISRIELFIAEPSLWEYIDIKFSKIR